MAYCEGPALNPRAFANHYLPMVGEDTHEINIHSAGTCCSLLDHHNRG